MKHSLLHNFPEKEIKKKKNTISHLKGATKTGKFVSKSNTGHGHLL